MTAPPLSVVMPVRNAAPFLEASLASILTQTYADFEFVVLDDASTDHSREVLRTWQRRDSRIRLVESHERLGLVGSSASVIRHARAPICARMDADDISRPDRLRRQMDVLRARPDAPLVGTLWEGIDSDGRLVRPRDRARLLRTSVFAPFPHGSIMFRRAVYDAVSGYRSACTYWEDFDLYGRLAARGPLLVIGDALYLYRFHARATTAQPDLQHLAALDLMYRCADRAARGVDYSDLLADASRARVDPRTLRSLAAARLWAGVRTSTLGAFGRVEPPLLSPSRLRAISWALWGDVSPRSLRFALRMLIHFRDQRASRTIRDGSVVQWKRTT